MMREAVQQQFGEVLESLGFRGDGEDYRRDRPEFFDCIWFQRSSDGETFAVNLGVQPRFLVTGIQPNQTDCEIKWRLAEAGESDAWWPARDDLRSSAAHVKAMLRVEAEEFFGHFASLESAFGAVTPQVLAEGSTPWWFGVITRVRLALLAARALSRAGSRGQALAVARYGLANAGMAVGPKRELRLLIGELETVEDSSAGDRVADGSSDFSWQAVRAEWSAEYPAEKLPSQRDEQIRGLLSNPERQRGNSGPSADHHPVLRVFAERMASWAVRTGDRETLKAGLVALSLAGLGESRDTLTILPLFLDAARKLGVDPVGLFDEVAQAASPAAAAELSGFLRRHPEDQTLEAMGYREGRDNDGFRYERTW